MTAAELPAQRPVFPDMAIPALNPDPSARPRAGRTLVIAIALSLLLHALWSLWPVEPSALPDEPVLTATFTTMPPPPVPASTHAPAPAAVPMPKLPKHVQRARAVAAPSLPPSSKPAASPAVPDAQVPILSNDAASASVDANTGADASASADAGANAGATTGGDAASGLPASGDAATGANSATAASAATPAVVLPPRVELAYKVFLGTHGFMIGDATYRFEHDGGRYRISTVGQARGLAALLLRGKGRIESRGVITPTGLQPLEFSIERGSANRREIAYFDWDDATVTLNDGASAQLDAPAYDPLSVMWQPYFSAPGTTDKLTFSLATTRKVARYTLVHEGDEMIAWPQGTVDTERWHRRSEDGKTDAWFWLAPSMHYVPVKMRVTQTSRGTLEVLLDSIRVEDPATAGTETNGGHSVGSGLSSASVPRTPDGERDSPPRLVESTISGLSRGTFVAHGQ